MSEAQTTTSGQGATPPAEAAQQALLLTTPEAGKPAEAAAPDTKAAETTTTADKTAPKAPDKAPEAEISLKLPDGAVADDPMLKEFTSIAKDVGLKQEGAQKVADLYFKAQDSWVKNASSLVEKQNQAWLQEAKADPEFGGEKLQQSLTTAQKALTQFWGPEFAKSVGEWGLGNNPGFIRGLVKIGQALGEDTVGGTSGTPPGAGNSDEARHRQLYPSMFATK